MSTGPLYDNIERASLANGLIVMGALHPARVEARGVDHGTLILLGTGRDFWTTFSAAPEAGDGMPDPVDRWSLRVVGALARRFGGQALFPFGGPPYSPFIDWALRSERAFTSPVGMLVHDTVGLMISYRGALHFGHEIPFPAPPAGSPCMTCVEKPCLDACPVGALGAGHGYDLAACHGYLDSDPGRDCMERGCAVRRACPLSAGAGRPEAQSALHMRAFQKPPAQRNGGA